MERIKSELRVFSDKEKAEVLQGFFKTGPGQYGEGDIFLGVSVPNVRKIARSFGEGVSFGEVRELLNSGIHEERLVALLILAERYEKGSGEEKQKVYDFYLENASRVNNWDLVDLSAPKIVGAWLLNCGDRKILYDLARSGNLWERRIAIVSTYAFIRAGEFDDTLVISKILLGDSHDLIHKAVGWMLREVGKRDREVLEGFLAENYSELPRTTLRYAIERFPEDLRKKWLLGNYERN